MAIIILSKRFKQLAFFATVLTVSLALGNFVFAVWTEPDAVPPGNNASAPINVSTIDQTKPARLDVSSLYDADDGSYYINPSATLTPSGVFAGRIGIGPENKDPTALLHVQGNHDLVNVPPWWYGDEVLFEIGDFIVRDSSPVIKLETTNWLGVEHRNFGITSYSDEKLHIFSENDDGTGKKSRITINGTNGYVGIGITNPISKLHVVGDTDLNPPVDARISVQNIDAASKKSELCFSRPDTGAGAWCIGTDFWAQNDDDFFIWGGGADGGADQGRLYIDSTGNIGIGTSNPSAQLHLEGDSGNAGEIALVHTQALTGGSAGISFNVTADLSSYAIKANSNKLGFYTLNPTMRRMTMLPNGNIGIGDADPTEAKLVVNGTAGNFTGVWSNLSDRRLKENIAPLESSLDKVLQLEGVSFEWKDQARGEGLQRGFIAQDAQKVIPEWVRENDDGYLMLEKVGVEALLVEAIKEQQAQIEELKLEIEQLKK